MIGGAMEKKLHEAKIEDFKGKVRGLKSILADIKLTLKQVRKDNTTFPKDQFDSLKMLKILVRIVLKYLTFLPTQKLLNSIHILHNISLHNS